MQIIAIDPGTKCGWRSPTYHGVWDLKTKSYESKGMKLIKFRTNLRALVESEDQIDLIVYEKPGGRNFTGIKSHANFEGVLQEFCLDHRIEYKGYSAGEIKRFATGKGNCGKPEMIAAANKKWPDIEILDDNHADALWLYALANSEFNI